MAVCGLYIFDRLEICDLALIIIKLMNRKDTSGFLIYNRSCIEVFGNLGKTYDFLAGIAPGFDTARSSKDPWTATIYTATIITGSHNSGTSDLDPTLGIAVDQSKTVRSLGNCCCVIPVIHRWSKTQNLSIKQQLEAGIRYLDLRIAVHPGNMDFHFVHGLYGGLILPAMREVKAFLEKNPREIVILDFNHFYNMNLTSHETLLREIITIFDGLIIPPDIAPKHAITLTSLWNKQGRIIICYQDDESSAKYNLFWSKYKMKSPWANTNSTESLIAFHENIYVNKQRYMTDDFYVWQGVLTPAGREIVTHLCGSLEENFSANGSKAFVTWLKQKKPGEQEINICSADFVEKHDFVPSVIGLNDKIL